MIRLSEVYTSRGLRNVMGVLANIPLSRYEFAGRFYEAVASIDVCESGLSVYGLAQLISDAGGAIQCIDYRIVVFNARNSVAKKFLKNVPARVTLHGELRDGSSGVVGNDFDLEDYNRCLSEYAQHVLFEEILKTMYTDVGYAKLHKIWEVAGSCDNMFYYGNEVPRNGIVVSLCDMFHDTDTVTLRDLDDGNSRELLQMAVRNNVSIEINAESCELTGSAALSESFCCKYASITDDPETFDSDTVIYDFNNGITTQKELDCRTKLIEDTEAIALILNPVPGLVYDGVYGAESIDWENYVDTHLTSIS